MSEHRVTIMSLDDAGGITEEGGVIGDRVVISRGRKIARGIRRADIFHGHSPIKVKTVKELLEMPVPEESERVTRGFDGIWSPLNRSSQDILIAPKYSAVPIMPSESDLQNLYTEINKEYQETTTDKEKQYFNTLNSRDRFMVALNGLMAKRESSRVFFSTIRKDIENAGLMRNFTLLSMVLALSIVIICLVLIFAVKPWEQL